MRCAKRNFVKAAAGEVEGKQNVGIRAHNGDHFRVGVQSAES
jgi:hypothetical protein